jgi:uncharacterized protein YjbJ (UPF0337 family)
MNWRFAAHLLLPLYPLDFMPAYAGAAPCSGFEAVCVATWPAFCNREGSRERELIIQGGCMNKDQVKGTAQKVKGKLNEAVGKATGNRSQEIKGDLQQVAGGIRQSFGNAKARIRKTVL